MWAPRERTSKLRSEAWDSVSCWGICRLFSSPNIRFCCFALNREWQRNQPSFWNEKISFPLWIGAWEDSGRGMTDENVQHCAWPWVGTQQTSPSSFWLLPLPPAGPKLAHCLNLQWMVHHRHNALCFKMGTDISYSKVRVGSMFPHSEKIVWSNWWVPGEKNVLAQSFHLWLGHKFPFLVQMTEGKGRVGAGHLGKWVPDACLGSLLEDSLQDHQSPFYMVPSSIHYQH